MAPASNQHFIRITQRGRANPAPKLHKIGQRLHQTVKLLPHKSLILPSFVPQVRPMKQRLPIPRTPRELLEMFVLFIPSQYDADGLQPLLQSADFRALNRADLVRIAMGREPHTPPPTTPDFQPRTFLRTLLNGRDCMLGMRKMVAEAYPEKRRAIFVHIPKCAGTDLIESLWRCYPLLREADFDPAQTQPDKMFSELRDFVIGARYSDTIAFSGHDSLSWYRNQGLLRPQDEIFTIIRDPTALVYSFVSYVLTVCENARTDPRPDATVWLGQLGITALSENLSAADMVALGRRILHCPEIIKPDRLCHFLGNGRAAGALQAIKATNIEITDTQRYSAWRAARFGTGEGKRLNPSRPYFTKDTASADDAAYVAEITAEDRILYGRLGRALADSGGLSVHGGDIN